MVAPTRSGIPTTYRNARFRSRLEAHWAAFFDLVGWRWTYEPVDTGSYTPDFLIHGPWPFFIEVGPCVSWADYHNKAAKAAASAAALARDVLIVGVSPVAPDLWTREVHAYAGWMGEAMQGPEDAGVSLDWAPAVWGTCTRCHAIGVVHTVQTYCLRPCTDHQSGGFGIPLPAGDLEDLWNRAGNAVQWRAAESSGRVSRRRGR